MAPPERSTPRTLLEQLIQDSDRTVEEHCADFEMCARELDERGASLSVRQLGRWMAGEVDNARPQSRRVAKALWGHGFRELLAGPRVPVDRTRGESAYVPSANLLSCVGQNDELTPRILPVQAADMPVQAADNGGSESVISAPKGRFFSGATIPVRVYHAIDDGRILAALPPGFIDEPFLSQSRRALIVGVTPDDEGDTTAYGIDVRHARRKLTRRASRRLILSRSLVLDDLTLGLLWALANFDEPLLDDDAALAYWRQQLSPFRAMSRSSGGHEIAADLSRVSQMWLGSSFCAEHILRNLSSIDVATFWTREQRGEEASAWLLFAHKYRYLQETSELYRKASESPSRAFCVPADTVSESTRPERILLMLAIALMESFGIRTHISGEPEYSVLDGFVRQRRRRAIVANWVGAEGVWYVDSIGSGARLAEFDDATQYAQAHSITSAETSRARLGRLAEYLGLDLRWLSDRCRQLGEYGVSPLIQPRSRLLSIDGIQRACACLGQLSGLQE